MSENKMTIEQEAENFWQNYFCLCGETEMALDAFREIMGLFELRSHGAYHLSLEKFEAYEAKYGVGLAYCILYWIEGMRLTDHGGNTIGSWLTTLGEKVREEVVNGTPKYFREDDE